MSKFSIMNHSFTCDGLIDYPHYSPIKKLIFVQRSANNQS